MLEYSWNGSGWNGPVDVGGSPRGQEIHNCTIGPGRGDGKERMYIASYDFNIYEIWHDETGWHQMTVGNVGSNLGMHTVVGVGRNDGVTRLYAASTQQLYEFTWNGTSWRRILIGNTPGAHELALVMAAGTGKTISILLLFPPEILKRGGPVPPGPLQVWVIMAMPAVLNLVMAAMMVLYVYTLLYMMEGSGSLHGMVRHGHL